MVQLLQGSCCHNPEPFAFAVISISFSEMGQLALSLFTQLPFASQLCNASQCCKGGTMLPLLLSSAFANVNCPENN